MPGLLLSIRRGTARRLKRLPGGRHLLAVGRIPIQIAQYLASRHSPGANVHQWFREAHDHLYSGRHEAAIALYDRIIELDPESCSSYYHRAMAKHWLGRIDEAMCDCQRAISIDQLSEKERLGAFCLLSSMLVGLGDFERGIEVGFRARWWRAFRLEPLRAVFSGRMFEHDATAILSETLHELAEYAMNHGNDVPTARLLYARCEALRIQYAKLVDPAESETLYLNEEWTRNIGHIGFLDYLLKMGELGWARWKKVVLLAPPARTANVAYLNSYRHRVTIDPSPVSPPMPRHLSVALGYRVSDVIPLPDGTTPYLPEALGIIQEEWERQGREPQLKLTADDIRFGERQLRAMGVPEGAWFVGLHVRSAGFYDETATAAQAHRNANIESYVPAIEEIARRGGWVIRMGDSKMPPLPEVRGGIDYARSRFKSDRMDVFLCARSRFFMCVASGLGNVPATFGVPCLSTNWVSNALPFYSRHDLFLPKLLRRKSDGQLLTFNEWLSRPMRDACYSGVGIRNAGLEAVDNTPEELRAGVIAMLDQAEGKPILNDESRERDAAFTALAKSHGARGFARVVPDFLQRHADLLG
jgi:putative glycosyltransferase (TIGR04372 family)